jgi:hypothetical protein
MPKFSSVDVLFTRTPEGWDVQVGLPANFSSAVNPSADRRLKRGS